MSGFHYIIKAKPIFAMVDNSQVVIKKRKNSKYKILFNKLSSTSSLVVPSDGVTPIEFISVTADPNVEHTPVLSDAASGINGANKFNLYNCNESDTFVIRGMNIAASNANIKSTDKISPIKATIGLTGEPETFVKYDATKPIELKPKYQVSIESDKNVVLNRATLICDNVVPLSLFAYFIDTAGVYKGVKFDNIKNDIFLIDLYNK